MSATYSSKTRCIGKVAERLDACVVHGECLEVLELLEELLVVLAQLGDLQLVEDQV